MIKHLIIFLINLFF